MQARAARGMPVCGRCDDVMAVVEKSCALSPPMTHDEWAERYSGGGGSWTRWIPFMGGGARAQQAAASGGAAAGA